MDDNTAIEVEHAGTDNEQLRVLGTHGISILDLRQAMVHHDTAGWSISGVHYSYLTNGDRYDPRTWHTRPARGKQSLRPSGDTPVAPNSDVFSSYANDNGHPYSFSGTARELTATAAQRTTTATTFESNPTFRVHFARTRQTHAWTTDGRTTASLTDLRIAIAPA
ncbi:hypothetical protein [Streptomyces sp. NPDC001070]